MYFIYLFLEVLTCPTCRTEHTLPTKGVEGFSTNFPIANLVELLSLHRDSPSVNSPLDSHKCENEIDSDPATSKCIDCDYYLCENCTIFHKKQKVTKNHVVVSIADIKSGKVRQLSQKRYCLEHEGEELKLYCRTCEEVICRDCTIVTHKQHDYTFIKDVTQILLGKLQDLSFTVRQKQEKIRDVIDYIHSEKQEEQQKLESHEYKAKKFFDDHIAALQARIEMLQQRRDGFLEELANSSSSHLKQLTVQEEEFQLSCACISSALAFFEQLELSASSTDLAMMSQQVCERFKALKNLPSGKDMVKMSPWSVALNQKDPLKSKVVSLPDLIAISDLGHSACFGKNTFTLYLQNFPQAYDKANFPQTKVEVNCQDWTKIPQTNDEAKTIFSVIVNVNLPSGIACPAKIDPAGNQSWSVSYFISPPRPDEIIISVTVNNIEATQSPFKLQCRNAMASGTRVQERSTGRRATAHNADFTHSEFVSVTWDDRGNYSNSYGYHNSRPNTIQLSNLMVLSE